MGDFFFGHDIYTSGLLSTLQRLGLDKNPFTYTVSTTGGVLDVDVITAATSAAVSNFGSPTTVTLSNPVFTLSECKKMFKHKNVDWYTKDLLPVGIDINDMKDELSDKGYSKFQFLETLRRLDMGKTGFYNLGSSSIMWNYAWTADAEI